MRALRVINTKRIRYEKDTSRLYAWCSGTSYQLPDMGIFIDKDRIIKVFTHGVYLAKFHYKTKKIYEDCKVIVRNQIAKSLTHPNRRGE